eukprot:scaffold39437_cov33-Phaeocystis_antarctica.AAC.2
MASPLERLIYDQLLVEAHGAGRTRALGICRGALLAGPDAGQHARGGCHDRDGALPADHGCR